ncbi:MAG: HNH endonuclease signature motif containing protein [Citrobacter telavivensis]
MYEHLRELLELDEASPSFLRWKVKPSRPIAKGAPALAYVRPDGYMSGKVKGKVYYTHRVVFFLHYGYMPEEVDHIDGNRANNNPSNLRDASRQQNMQNMKARGYSFDRHHNKFRARIYLNNKEIILGYFDKEEEAREAYLQGKRKYHSFATDRCFGGVHE